MKIKKIKKQDLDDFFLENRKKNHIFAIRKNSIDRRFLNNLII